MNNMSQFLKSFFDFSDYHVDMWAGKEVLLYIQSQLKCGHSVHFVQYMGQPTMRKLERCGSSDLHKKLLETDLHYRKNVLDNENFTRYYEKYYSSAGSKSGIIRIPVVVHVVWNTSAQDTTKLGIRLTP